MKRSTKLIIEIVAVIVIFVIASIAYNNLKDGSLANSYVPTISAEKIETIVEKTDDKILQENGVAVNVEPNNSSEQIASNEEIIPQKSDKEETSENSEVDSTNSSLMPDIPVIMYPSKEELTFWNMIPKGKPVVINLFASWCPPCKEEMPGFVEARETYKDEVTFVFFDSFDGNRETEATLKAFADKTFADDTLIVLDPGYIGYLFNSNSIPLTIMLNSEGEIVKGFQGAISKDTLIGEIENLLN